MMRVFARLYILLVGFSLLAACAGSGPLAGGGAPTPGGSGANFSTMQQTILDVNCLSGGCHNATDRAGDLVLTAGQSYNNLVGAASFNLAASAAGLQRVVPFNPDTSFLLIKLVGPAAGEGSRMPLGAPPLSSD